MLGPLAEVSIGLATIVGVATTCRLAARRATRGTYRDLPFKRDELRELEAGLRAAAADELSQIAGEVDRYVGGVRVGYVVSVVHSADGMSLELSDGRSLSLSGVAHRTKKAIAAQVQDDLLRPSSVEADGPSYRLRLRGHHGSDVELYARRMSLAAPAA